MPPRQKILQFGKRIAKRINSMLMNSLKSCKMERKDGIKGRISLMKMKIR